MFEVSATVSPELLPKPAAPTQVASWRTLRRLLGLLDPFRWQLAAAVGLGTATILSSVALLGTSAYIISEAALHPSIAALSVAIVGVRFFGLSRGVLRYLERLTTHSATFQILTSLRIWLYTALIPLAPAWLLRARSGDVHARLVSDVETLEHFFVRAVAPPAVALVTTVSVWGLLFHYDLQLANAAVAFLLLAGVGVPFLAYGLGREPGRRLILARADQETMLVDTLQGMSELVAFGHADRRRDELEAQYRLVRHLQRRLAVGNAIGTGATLLLQGLATLAILMVAVPLIASQKLEGVLLASMVLIVEASFEAVMPLPAALSALGGSLAAAERLFALADSQPEVIDRAVVSPIPQRFDLAVHDVRFRYSPAEPDVLGGVSFYVPSGNLVAVVGPSGSGKSSLLHLLVRSFPFTSGSCLVGGCELADLRQEDVPRYVGLVGQTTHLFNATLRENLLLARPEASEEELLLASRRAQLDEFIARLPRGYQTVIGENGLRLSGGERQRLALARAFLADTPVLLLDEPLEHLDRPTAAAVWRGLLEARAGRTTVVVTHELNNLDAANEILVLEGGCIVERGSQRRLLAMNGPYRRLWERQQLAADAAV